MLLAGARCFALDKFCKRAEAAFCRLIGSAWLHSNGLLGLRFVLSGLIQNSCEKGPPKLGTMSRRPVILVAHQHSSRPRWRGLTTSANTRRNTYNPRPVLRIAHWQLVGLFGGLFEVGRKKTSPGQSDMDAICVLAPASNKNESHCTPS